jgi:hypothetical protein
MRLSTPSDGVPQRDAENGESGKDRWRLDKIESTFGSADLRACLREGDVDLKLKHALTSPKRKLPIDLSFSEPNPGVSASLAFIATE